MEASVSVSAAHAHSLTGGFLARELFVSLAALTDESESVYGFGVQYSVLDMKGRVVPIVTSEQGVGTSTRMLSLSILIVTSHFLCSCRTGT